jgi:2-amino-4-hydroxy-6-hydroxymethyldihydropteridine diphosphokinase
LLTVVGLGSNLGDRLGALREAAREIGSLARIERGSHVYETAPVLRPAAANETASPPQPPYLNAAALVRVESDPLDWLDQLLAIERRLGRVRRERWGPRTIDLDILWIDRVAFMSERLVVPHPLLTERAFALAPLLEACPGARDPRTGAPYIVPPGDIRRTEDLLCP